MELDGGTTTTEQKKDEEVQIVELTKEHEFRFEVEFENKVIVKV